MICFALHIKAIDDYSRSQIFIDAGQCVSNYYSSTEPGGRLNIKMPSYQ